MGKKGNWFSALKRAFTSSSKDNIAYSSEKKYAKEKKKWGVGRSKHGEVNSFMPLYREPSSIEKILRDAEREQHHRIHQDPHKKVQHFRSPNEEPPKKVQHFHSSNEEHHRKVQQFHSPKEELPQKALYLQAPNQEPPKKVQHIRAPKPKPAIASHRRAINLSYAQSSAIKIQAAFKGYMARKSYQALKGLVRLQRVMRGQSVKRQTTNTMRCMQLLVRVQSQVRSRRLQMIESRNHQQPHATPGRSEKEIENSFSRWNLTQSEAEADEEWDDSVLTMEERDTRTRRKVEAVIKRERALAYAYSHQLLKVTPKSAQAVLTDIRSGGYPWWWNWLDRQVLHEPLPTPLPKTPALLTPMFASVAPPATSFRPSSHSQPRRDIFEAPTSRSSKAAPSPRTNHPLKTSNHWSQSQLRDDDSLTSCPPFRPVPNYMAPTVSAMAKVRDSQDAGRYSHDGGKKRFSFSLTQSIGSLRWGKGPLFAAKEPEPVQRMVRGKHWSTNSIGGVSVDSTVSLPAGVGMKPFK